MSFEQRLVILCSRLTFSDNVENELAQLITEKLDWYEIFRISLKNKVLGLVWFNLNRLGYENYVFNRLAQVAQFMVLGTRERNHLLKEEMKRIMSRFEEEGVKCAPTKGMCLIDNLYSESGTRTNVDIDALVYKTDEKKIIYIMQNEGYNQGEYDSSSRTFIPITRQKKIFWKMHMNNVFPFKKLSKNEYIQYYTFDFCFSLDLNINTIPVSEMLDRSVKTDDIYCLNESDMLLHLCCHLYKESVNAVDVLKGSDLNLIKFCDVREFYLQKMDKDSVAEAIKNAKKYGKEDALYYTFYHLKEIYGDGYEDEILNQLELADLEFLDTFGEENYKRKFKWKKSFLERLFSTDNNDELPDAPGYFDLTPEGIRSWK